MPSGPDEVHLCATIYGREPATLGGGVVWTMPLVTRPKAGRITADIAAKVGYAPESGCRPDSVGVNMGMGGLSVTPALPEELGRDRPVSFSVGSVPVVVDTAGVSSASADDFVQRLGSLPVEPSCPFGVLRQFRVTLDDAAPRVTLAPLSDASAPGAAVRHGAAR